jgi:lipopolysaccharide export system protein LptC
MTPKAKTILYVLVLAMLAWALAEAQDRQLAKKVTASPQQRYGG